MNKKNILKEASVLFGALCIVLSTVAVTAHINNNTQLLVVCPENPTINRQIGPQTLNGIVVWDNGMNYDNSLAAQYDPDYPLDAYPADDFYFEEDTEVGDVHWIGAYFNGDPEPFDWCISFMNDDGTGNAPDSHPQDPSFAGPFCYTWEEIEKVDLGDGYFEMSVDLPENIMFPGCYKFWISIWGEGSVYPQSMWGCHYQPILLHQAVFGSDYFGFPYWSDSEDVLGNPADMCFQLTRKCYPNIDVEKYVWDPRLEKWVQADSEPAAVNLPICTDAKFKIIIQNAGVCCDLFNINIYDTMHDSLKYISADPKPNSVEYKPPFYEIYWLIPGPLSPNQKIVINLTAHVEGPECSTDSNHAEALAQCDCEPYIVKDDDWAYVHAYKKARVINAPFLNFLTSHPNLFPILQRLIMRLGLQN